MGIQASEIAANETERDRYLKHASAAKQGYVLGDRTPGFSLTHGRIMAEASKRGRLLHETDEDKLPVK
jgi:hypothetical protein